MSKARPLTNTDKDFGRRLYASDKGYTEQMKEVTDKAKLDVKPFHLSEFKKPYLTDDYVEMEHRYSPVAGIPPVPPSLLDNSESETTGGKMRWKVDPPDEGEPEHWYLVEVWNRVKEQTTTLNGKTTKYQRIYYPAWFEMKNTQTGTKGFKLEISLSNAVLDAAGEIRGFYAGNNIWYDIKTQQATIKAILAYLHEKGTTQAFTTARLTLDADADGEVEVKAKDGKTEIKEKVKATEEAPPMPDITTDYWLRLVDITGYHAGYYLPIDSAFQATGDPVHESLITFEEREDKNVQGHTHWYNWSPSVTEYAGYTTEAFLLINGVVWKTGGASFNQILRPAPIHNTYNGVTYMEAAANCDFINVPEDGITMWTEIIGRGETTDPPVHPSYHSSKLSKFGVVSTLYEGDGPLMDSPLENKSAQRGQASYFASNGSWYYSYVVIDWNSLGQPELKLFIIDENGAESSKTISLPVPALADVYVFEVLPGYYTKIGYGINRDEFAIRRGSRITHSNYWIEARDKNNGSLVGYCPIVNNAVLESGLITPTQYAALTNPVQVALPEYTFTWAREAIPGIGWYYTYTETPGGVVYHVIDNGVTIVGLAPGSVKGRGIPFRSLYNYDFVWATEPHVFSMTTSYNGASETFTIYGWGGVEYKNGPFLHYILNSEWEDGSKLSQHYVGRHNDTYQHSVPDTWVSVVTSGNINMALPMVYSPTLLQWFVDGTLYYFRAQIYRKTS
jgi:hypothetical protein